MRNISILVIDDEPNMRQMLMSLLGRYDYSVSAVGDGESGITFCMEQEAHVVLCDVQMPGSIDGLEVLRRLHQHNKHITVIMMSAYATVDIAIEAMRCGAYNFITKPFTPDEVLRSLEKAVEIDGLKRENRKLKDEVQELRGASRFGGIIGESTVLTELINRAKKVADFSSTVLITGESGTGKELFAKGLHQYSIRQEKPFLSINCASIPGELLETEFFGHRKGAFTGAVRDHDGLFIAADGGTVFLDEIAELPIELQVKLLRALQEGEVRPVGSTEEFSVDVRVVAATSRNLQQLVLDGLFRQDLLYRLNVIELHIPPLRERREDIPLLVEHFITQCNCRFDKLKKPIVSIEPKAVEMLLRYNWPGNVRELENALEHAFVYSEGKILLAENFPEQIGGKTFESNIDKTFAEIYSLKEAKKILEGQMIDKALKATHGNKSKAAELLEISYPSLLSKLKDRVHKE